MTITSSFPDSVRRLAKCGRQDLAQTAKAMVRCECVQLWRSTGLRQQDFAALASISLRSLNNYLSGATCPDAATMRMMRAAAYVELERKAGGQ